MDVFGGSIETPAMHHIADAGIRYSNELYVDHEKAVLPWLARD
jgi:hypothetical protein